MARRWAILCAAALMLTGFLSLTPPVPVNEQVLVNKENPLSSDFVPAGLTVCQVQFASGTPDERKQLTAAAAKALESLFDAAQEDGITLYAVSGYRSYASQKAIYNRRLEETSLSYVSRYIARAGESEHQTGLAMDLADRDTRLLEESFAETEAYAWLVRRAWEFGFVVRYPQDGESETGYAFEPWHIRYLGDIAGEVWRSGMTYERYLAEREKMTYAQGRLPLSIR